MQGPTLRFQARPRRSMMLTLGRLAVRLFAGIAIADQAMQALPLVLLDEMRVSCPYMHMQAEAF